MKTNLSVREAEAVFLYILKFKQVPGWLNLIWHYNLTWDMRWEIDFGLGLKTTLDMNEDISLNRSQLSTVFRVIVAKIFDTSPVAQQIQLMRQGPAPCQLTLSLGIPDCGQGQTVSP